MKRVIIESPYFAEERVEVEKHLGYLRRCYKDSLMRGEAPLASHRNYTWVLHDRDPVEREIGIQAGLSWAERADLTAVYTDYGISPGMQQGIEHAHQCGREVQYRTINSQRPTGDGEP